MFLTRTIQLIFCGLVILTGSVPAIGCQSSGDDTQTTTTGAIGAGHEATSGFLGIPESVVDQIQADFRIFFGHTSHGSQIISGMEMLMTEDDGYAVNAGPGSLSIIDFGGEDLGHNGDVGWVDSTRAALDADSSINVVMWSWCAGVSDNTESGITTYLTAMDGLEDDYPTVTFIYMTGHLHNDEYGVGTKANLEARNEQIREYCENNGKILFDFADIESYDPDGNVYPNDTDTCHWCEAWCTSHSCPTGDCAHSVAFNCYRKGQAFWWLLARMTGWSGE